ncbi:hypothetical protein [Actinoplanes rectilineatus]|uniref:hypothetical protein n=1 Tax=Actinoplanes rectilineatus TaxID=113571 RepID=UPI0005F2BE1C|nr:hypothetical protein [Actinoplanes rectilineatus]
MAPVNRHLSLLLFWPLAGAVGLFALWLHGRRIAARDGIGEGSRSYRPIALGYLVSVPVLALTFVPAFLAGAFAPLVWPAAILLAAAIRQHSAALRRAATLVAADGLLQGLLVLIAWSTGSGTVIGRLSLGVDLLVAIGMLIAAMFTSGVTRAH